MAKQNAGTKENPWKLKTAPGTSEYTMYKEEEILVCKVGSTTLHYQWRCVDDLVAMLKKHGDWIELGAADEQKPAKENRWPWVRGVWSAMQKAVLLVRLPRQRSRVRPGHR